MIKRTALMAKPRTSQAVPAARGLLQRCTGSACGRAHEEDERPLLRQRGRGPEPDVVPPVVDAALRTSSQPLDAATRAFFEPRFGHDFGQVRVHTDSTAAASSRAVNALAYTVGRDVVFAAGRYAPGTAAGRRLLAHELTHVVQQGGRTSPVPLRLSISAIFSPLEDEAEAAADAIAAGEAPQVEERAEAAGSVQRAPVLPLGVDLAAPLQAGANVGALAASCDHSAALTWAEFTAKAPQKSRFAAETRFHFDQATVGSQTAIKAFFDGKSSWVRRDAANPTDRVLNGGSAQIGACERHFDRAARKKLINVTYHLNPGAGCTASIQPDSTLLAHSRADCATVLGPEWDRVAVLESQRLLKHEQYHYTLACALARKGTQAILNGGKAGDILRAVRAAGNSQTTSYDTDSSHGCDASGQATWEKEIDGGLPKVTIP